jgi:hypothetical protein
MKSIIYVSFMLTGNDECMNYIIVIKKTKEGGHFR